jgi:hypothetical protein
MGSRAGLEDRMFGVRFPAGGWELFYSKPCPDRLWDVVKHSDYFTFFYLFFRMVSIFCVLSDDPVLRKSIKLSFRFMNFALQGMIRSAALIN